MLIKYLMCPLLMKTVIKKNNKITIKRKIRELNELKIPQI